MVQEHCLACLQINKAVTFAQHLKFDVTIVTNNATMDKSTSVLNAVGVNYSGL